MSRVAFAFFVILALAGCVARRPPLAPLAPVAASVDVTKRGEVWTADFHLDRPAPIWVLFPPSAWEFTNPPLASMPAFSVELTMSSA